MLLIWIIIIIIILFGTMAFKKSLGWVLYKDKLKGDCCPTYFGGRTKAGSVIVLADSFKTIRMKQLRAHCERNEDCYAC